MELLAKRNQSGQYYEFNIAVQELVLALSKICYDLCTARLFEPDAQDKEIEQIRYILALTIYVIRLQ